MIALFVWLVGLFGTFLLSVGGLTYVAVTLVDGRPFPFRIPAGMFCGYIAGALFIWKLVPDQWELSLLTTLAAAVNAEKYGHTVEHSAEGILVWMLFGAVVGAILGGVLAHLTRGRFGRRIVAEAH